MTNARLDLPKVDGSRPCTGPWMVSGSLELATFYQHVVTSIELTDKWHKKYAIEANLRPFLSNIDLLQAKSSPAKSIELI